MAYTRYNKPVGTLAKLAGHGLLVVKVTKTCERSGRPKSWEDFPLFITTQNAKTRYGAEYYYIQPVKNGPTLRVYFNLVPWPPSEDDRINVYRWDPLNDVYRLQWTSRVGGGVKEVF